MLLSYLILYIMLETKLRVLSLSEGDISEFRVGKYDFREGPEITRQFKTRCTRRYSPGVCASHVSPVWTFVFQEQNCTERLGCASYFRSNRFKNYQICMRHCQGLIDVYLQMLEGEDRKNRSAPLRKGHKPKSGFIRLQGRRYGADYPTAQELEDIDYQPGDYEHGENETHSIVYKDLINNYNIFPPDVDREDGEIRSQYDLLHP